VYDVPQFEKQNMTTATPSANDRALRSVKQLGFTLVETVMTLSIMMALSGVTVPKGLRVVHSVQLNAASGNVANLIARTRFEAIRLNTPISCLQTTIGSQAALFIDLDGDGLLGANEPSVVLPSGISFLTGGIPETSSMRDGAGDGAAAAPTSTVLTFDRRGMPTFTGVFTYFIGFDNVADGYRSVAVTPVGRVIVWRANGQMGSLDKDLLK
jgi:Tfp pilus assembly protein FimT